MCIRDSLRTIRDLKPRSIVQLGVGDGQQALEILEYAKQQSSPTQNAQLSYCGVDLFEASPPDHPHLTLREAHKQFSAVADKVRLVPGAPESTLQRCANDLTGTDLLVISKHVEQCETLWTFAPRMLIPESLVLIESKDEPHWRILTPTEIPAATRTSNGKRSAA